MQEQDACGQSMAQKFIDGKCAADELNIIREMAPETFGKCLETLKLGGGGRVE